MSLLWDRSPGAERVDRDLIVCPLSAGYAQTDPPSDLGSRSSRDSHCRVASDETEPDERDNEPKERYNEPDGRDNEPEEHDNEPKENDKGASAALLRGTNER